MCFDYMSLRKVASSPETTLDSSNVCDDEFQRKGKGNVQRDDSNSEYEESNQMDVEINTDGARLQCVDYNDGEVPNFSEHVKFIYHDLLKSDEITFAKHFLAYICARLYEGTGDKYNPTLANNIKAVQYGDRYHTLEN